MSPCPPPERVPSKLPGGYRRVRGRRQLSRLFSLMKPSWKAVLKRPLRLISFSFEVIWLTDFHCDDLFPKDDRHAAESGWNEDHSDRDINHSSLNGYPSTWNGTLLNRNAYQS